MSRVIRLTMFVTLIVLVSFVVEQEALQTSKMLAVKSYSAEERSRAMQLMRQRAIDKIRANILGSHTERARPKCDTSDITACMPTGPAQNFTEDMSLAALKKFCQYALDYAQCISDIDVDACKGSMLYNSYIGAANAALMFSALCPDETLTDVYNNIKCIIAALEDESCEDVFDDEPNDNTGICKDYVTYLQCYYDETMDKCNNDEIAADVVERIVNIKMGSLLKQYGIDCTPPGKRTKTDDIVASLVGSKTNKRSQLLDLLDKLANKKFA